MNKNTQNIRFIKNEEYYSPSIDPPTWINHFLSTTRSYYSILSDFWGFHAIVIEDILTSSD